MNCKRNYGEGDCLSCDWIHAKYPTKYMGKRDLMARELGKAKEVIGFERA